MVGEKKSHLFKTGDHFGGYTLLKLLGVGGMGVVYLAHASDSAHFAVKVMDSDMARKNPDFRKRFLREGEFAVKIRHPNLIPVHCVGEDPETGLCYLVMDYLSGGSLADRLNKHGRLPIEEAVDIIVQIADALEVAHRHGVIHRDIKPDNVMFDADGTPKLADLGVAKFTDGEYKTTVTTTGMIIGTPAYMAPEQMMDSRHIDARADIYALGVVLYEMLTGKRPREGSTAVELLAKAIKGESLPDVRTLRPEISAAVAYVLSLMCAPKPDSRPASARTAAELLHKATNGTLVLPKSALHVVTEEEKSQRERRRRLTGIALVSIGLLLLVTVVLVGWVKAFKDVAQAKPSERMVVTNVIDQSIAFTNVSEQANAQQPSKKRNDLADGIVRHTKVGSHTWYYTIEGNEAVLWRGETVYNSKVQPAVEPSSEDVIVIPAELDGYKVTKIGACAFAKCTDVKSVSIPEGIKELRQNCFLDCKSLKSVTLPSTLTRIFDYAFRGCHSLKTLDIGDCPDVSGIAFSGCSHLSRVSVSKTNQNYVEIDRALYTSNKETLVFFPRTVRFARLPDFVKEIGDGAFNSSPNLNYVSIPKNVITIGRGAFSECNKLFSLSFVEGLREVKSSAFSHCLGIRFVVFPASLERLEGWIFDGCDTLERITFRGDAPKMDDTVKWNLFGGLTSCDIVIAVKRGSKGWKKPGSTEIPEMWPLEGSGNSRPIRFLDTLEPIRLLGRRNDSLNTDGAVNKGSQ